MSQRVADPLPPVLRPLRARSAHALVGCATRSKRSSAGLGRRQIRAGLRAEAILALYVQQGLSYAQIAAKVGVSRQRVQQVIKAALAEAAKRSRGLAEYALDRELGLIEVLIRESAHILLTKCEVCGGDEVQRTRCETCKKTGYRYPAETRLEAIDRIGAASDRRIGLRGLDKEPPPRPASDLGNAYYEMLQTLSDEELAVELERLEAALTGEPIPE
jgi:transcriptional regulator with XRE-family HTH domain